MESRIITTATELFHQYGIKTISMDEIARVNGISKKTIYQYFSDKDDLVFKVISDDFEKNKAQFDEINGLDMNPIEENFFHIDHMKKALSNLSPSFFYDLQKYYPEADAIFHQFKKLAADSLKTNLEKGIKQGVYRADINLDILVTLRSEIVDLGFNNRIFDYNKYSVLDIQLQSLDHFLRGIVTEKGLEIYLKLKNNLIP